MENVPRLRFAPSPTGTPHIGNLHTALFSWALARSLRGDFILRIEDTDPVRNTPDAAEKMMAALAWLTIDWDEGPDIGGEYGPYVQSERLPRQQRVAEQLLDTGHAYYGDDPDRPQTAVDNPLRLRLPKNGQTILHDAIRGPITFDNGRLQDPVLMRSDGRPLYHLAAMSDDHDMGITHVVRGDEWFATAPIPIHLYQAMGWEQPVWVHLPLILNKKGQKLKKRDPEGGYLITDFQNAGYLPQALFNYLLLLGWSPDGEQEIISKWDVRQQFRLERLSAAPSLFDWEKLNWVNRIYLERLSDEKLAQAARPFLEDAYGALPSDEKWLVRLTAVTRTEFSKLEDIIDAAEWAFADNFNYDEAARRALASAPARPVLARLIAELAALVLLDGRTAQTILANMHTQFQERDGWSAGAVYQPIRAALTGAVGGPPLPDIMGILGKERTLQRLARALKSQNR